VLEYLTAKSGLDEKTAICFAYYNYRNTDAQAPLQIAEALLKQLCRQREAVPSELLDFKREARRPSLADMEQFFIKLPLQMSFDEVYIVIDALDECPKDQRPNIIGLLSMVMSSIPCAKVFVTSRREGDIERAFAESGTATIQIQADNIAADVRSFVESEVKKLRKGDRGKQLFLSSDVLEAKVILALTDHAGGM
jgi:hypothetical protein